MCIAGYSIKFGFKEAKLLPSPHEETRQCDEKIGLFCRKEGYEERKAEEEAGQSKRDKGLSRRKSTTDRQGGEHIVC